MTYTFRNRQDALQAWKGHHGQSQPVATCLPIGWIPGSVGMVAAPLGGLEGDVEVVVTVVTVVVTAVVAVQAVVMVRDVTMGCGCGWLAAFTSGDTLLLGLGLPDDDVTQRWGLLGTVGDGVVGDGDCDTPPLELGMGLRWWSAGRSDWP